MKRKKKVKYNLNRQKWAGQEHVVESQIHVMSRRRAHCSVLVGVASVTLWLRVEKVSPIGAVSLVKLDITGSAARTVVKK